MTSNKLISSIFAAVLLSATAASAANWTVVPEDGDKCKKDQAAFIGQLPGLGYSLIKKEKHAPLSASFSVCVRKNSNGLYELWEVQPIGITVFCRLAFRTGMNGACSNNPL
jgi:hypothetical protein